MRKMFKRTIVAVITFAALLCSGLTVNAAKPTQWLIYWYVCGTDIETNRIAFGSGTDLMSNNPNALILADPDKMPGDATRCINEVEAANLSPDVKIFMQAGGTYVWGHPKFRDLNAKIQTGLGQGDLIGNGNGFYLQWHLKNPLQPNTLMSNGKIGRYVYDKYHRNWHAREQLPISGLKDSATDMGSQAGLISFLQAGQKLEQSLYPDGNVRRVFIFVDHGQGSINHPLLNGVICSDAYTKNMLSLKEVRDAFATVRNGWTNPDEKPFEVVAFDACLMSTYETAVALENVANYMVASQETTYGKVGLNYTDLLNELSKNPFMRGKELGKVICNTRWDDSKVTDKEFSNNSSDLFTFSVVDLSENKMIALKTAYENFGAEAFNVAQQNPSDMLYTFAKFRNAASVAERYPSSEINAGLVDLRNFADNLRATFPELKEAGDALVKAIDNAVVYNKRGDALNRGGGLSTYYPFDLFGEDTRAGIEYYKSLGNSNLVPKSSGKFYDFLYKNMQGKSVNLSALKNKMVDVDEEKKIASVELSEDELKNVAGVRYQCIYIEPRNDDPEKMNALFLGSDSNVSENRQTGTFELNLRTHVHKRLSKV
ncbi:MAG: hypothetical protein IKE46_02280 [Selenomonadaceae bacterium]|nr:hypothetical protein [Selenomonadaceae bacterium]